MSRPFESIGFLGRRSYISLKKDYNGEHLVYSSPLPDFEDIEPAEVFFSIFMGIVGALLAFIILLPLNLILDKTLGDTVANSALVVELIYYIAFFYRNIVSEIINLYSGISKVEGFDDKDGQAILASTAMGKSGPTRYLTLREERYLNRYAKSKNGDERAKRVKESDERFNKFIQDNYGVDVKNSKLALESNKNKSRGEDLAYSSTVYKLDKNERLAACNYILQNIDLIESKNRNSYRESLTGVLANFDNLNESEKRNFVEILSILKSNIESYKSMTSIVSSNSEVVLDSREGLDTLFHIMIKPIVGMANRIAESKRDSIMIDSIYVKDKYMGSNGM